MAGAGASVPLGPKRLMSELRPMNAWDVLQQLYASEVNGGLSADWAVASAHGLRWLQRSLPVRRHGFCGRCALVTRRAIPVLETLRFDLALDQGLGIAIAGRTCEPWADAKNNLSPFKGLLVVQ
jgi:hypothetical protein